MVDDGRKIKKLNGRKLGKLGGRGCGCSFWSQILINETRSRQQLGHDMGVRVGTRYFPPIFRHWSSLRGLACCTHWTYQTWPIFPGTQFWLSGTLRQTGVALTLKVEPSISNYPLTHQKKYGKEWYIFPVGTSQFYIIFCGILQKTETIILTGVICRGLRGLVLVLPRGEFCPIKQALQERPRVDLTRSSYRACAPVSNPPPPPPICNPTSSHGSHRQVYGRTKPDRKWEFSHLPHTETRSIKTLGSV